MNQNQEPKYEVKDGKIVNRASQEPIPDNEPIMIFRARDKHAVSAILKYAAMCDNESHQRIVVKRAIDFARFQEDHPDRVKEPDTILPLND